MKKQTLVLVSILLFIIIAISCSKKDSAEFQPKQEENITLENGILKFSSETVFKSTLENLYNNQDK
jgi:ABC-type Fe3+-citrate transport system substrate-binding protein